MKRLLSPLLVLVSICILAPASAAQLDNKMLKKMKRWPADDQTWARALDAWMSAEELDVLVGLKTTEERKKFLEQAGYWGLWEPLEDEVKQAIGAKDVIKGMSQDEVFMSWDKPAKIRKDFKKDAYVDVLNYEFERDRKGREFLLQPDSVTAYKNEVFVRYVYLHNDRVVTVVDAGEEEDVLDALLSEDRTPAATPDAPASDAASVESNSGESDGGAPAEDVTGESEPAGGAPDEADDSTP